MREIITGRNAIYEVFRARRRQVFRLLVASGIDERGRVGVESDRVADNPCRFVWHVRCVEQTVTEKPEQTREQHRASQQSSG